MRSASGIMVHHIICMAVILTLLVFGVCFGTGVSYLYSSFSLLLRKFKYLGQGRVAHKMQDSMIIVLDSFYQRSLTFNDNNGRELNSAVTLASQPVVGHTLRFIITIVIMALD